MNKPIECFALMSIITFSTLAYSVPVLNCKHGDFDNPTKTCTKDDLKKALPQNKKANMNAMKMAQKLIEEADEYAQRVNREAQRLNSNNQHLQS